MEKVLIKKELEYYKLSTTKNKKYLQFFSKSFQILNCYMVVYYWYLLPLWVAMIILSNIFIFIFILYGCYYLFVYYLFFFVFIKIF